MRQDRYRLQKMALSEWPLERVRRSRCEFGGTLDVLAQRLSVDKPNRRRLI